MDHRTTHVRDSIRPRPIYTRSLCIDFSRACFWKSLWAKPTGIFCSNKRCKQCQSLIKSVQIEIFFNSKLVWNGSDGQWGENCGFVGLRFLLVSALVTGEILTIPESYLTRLSITPSDTTVLSANFKGTQPQIAAVLVFDRFSKNNIWKKKMGGRESACLTLKSLNFLLI